MELCHKCFAGPVTYERPRASSSTGDWPSTRLLHMLQNTKEWWHIEPNHIHSLRRILTPVSSGSHPRSYIPRLLWQPECEIRTYTRTQHTYKTIQELSKLIKNQGGLLRRKQDIVTTVLIICKIIIIRYFLTYVHIRTSRPQLGWSVAGS
jgi:hypothetical protein